MNHLATELAEAGPWRRALEEASLGIRMDDPGFPTMFSAADRPGTYLRIIEKGSLAAGDRIEVGPPPPHGLTVADIARIYDRDQHEAGRLLEAAQLSGPWELCARCPPP